MGYGAGGTGTARPTQASNVQIRQDLGGSGTRGNDARRDLAAYQTGTRTRRSTRGQSNAGRRDSRSDQGVAWGARGNARDPNSRLASAPGNNAVLGDALSGRFGTDVDLQEQIDTRAAGNNSSGQEWTELDPNSPEYARFKEESAAAAQKAGKTKAEWLNELYGTTFFNEGSDRTRGTNWAGGGGGGGTMTAGEQTDALDNHNLIRGFI